MAMNNAETPVIWLAVDLDGTLTTSDKNVTSFTLQTLLTAQQEGWLRIVIDSGRPVNGIAPVADLLQLDRYDGWVVAFNGGEIVRWSDRQCLFRQSLPAEAVPVIYNIGQPPFSVMTYVGQEILTETPLSPYVQKSARANRMIPRGVDSFLEAVDGIPLSKCIVVGEPVRLAALEESLRQQPALPFDFFRSEDFFLEFVPQGLDKASGLQCLSRHLGVPSSDFIAIGDAYNDIPMINWAGTGVAVANAKGPVLEAADLITRSNDDDGVAHFITQLKQWKH